MERAGSEHGVDLESWEFGLRQAVLCAGAQSLEKLVDGVGSGRGDSPLLCACGAKMDKEEKIIAKAERLLPACAPHADRPEDEDQRDELQKQIGYFRNNAARMRYSQFREQGLFVGSSVVEAGCKTVVGKRCLHLSGRTEEFWEQKAAKG